MYTEYSRGPSHNKLHISGNPLSSCCQAILLAVTSPLPSGLIAAMLV